MRKDGLPENVCVLDLETETVSFQIPEESRLAFVGTQVYNLGEGCYHHLHPRFFFPKDLHELEEFLQDFDGVVIGHNILQFDYNVLRMHFSGKLIPTAVVDKTIDTLYFLYTRNGGVLGGSLQGLSLDDLAKANFGYGKTVHGKTIPLLWRNGQREEVFQHNKEDLELTYKLWWHLIKERKVLTGAGRKIELTGEDVARLTGEKPLARRRLVMVKSGPPVPCPPKFEDYENYYTGLEDPYWYRWQLAEYDTENDTVIFVDSLSGETYDWLPFPANEFELEKDSVAPYTYMGPPVKLDEDAWP